MKKKVNILMVDDEPAKLLSYEVILSDLDENLINATSGKEALEQLPADSWSGPVCGMPGRPAGAEPDNKLLQQAILDLRPTNKLTLEEIVQGMDHFYQRMRRCRWWEPCSMWEPRPKALSNQS